MKSPHKQIQKVVDYFTIVEFACRGSVYLHWSANFEDALQYVEATNHVFAACNDTISFSVDVQPELKIFLSYQLHQHMRACRNGNTQNCRPEHPILPIPRPMILEPIQFDPNEEEAEVTERWCKILKHPITLVWHLT